MLDSGFTIWPTCFHWSGLAKHRHNEGGGSCLDPIQQHIPLWGIDEAHIEQVCPKFLLSYLVARPPLSLSVQLTTSRLAKVVSRWTAPINRCLHAVNNSGNQTLFAMVCMILSFQRSAHFLCSSHPYQRATAVVVSRVSSRPCELQRTDSSSFNLNTATIKGSTDAWYLWPIRCGGGRIRPYFLVREET